MGAVGDFCLNCCFWIQTIGIFFFCVMMILTSMDNYYMVSMEPTHKKNSILKMALAAMVC